MATKPSRSAREERRSTLKLLGGAGIAAVAIAGGVVGIVQMMPARTMGTGRTLVETLNDANLGPHILPLRGEGAPDVIVIGSSDCGFCRSMVAEGLETLISVAEELDLTVGYLGVATGRGSMASMQALDCLRDAPDPVAALRATYALSAEISAGGFADGLIPDRIQAIMDEQGVEGTAMSCWKGLDSVEASARARTISEAFAITGTPSFYVASEADPREIRVFSGFGGAASMARQIRNSRA